MIQTKQTDKPNTDAPVVRNNYFSRTTKDKTIIKINNNLPISSCHPSEKSLFENEVVNENHPC